MFTAREFKKLGLVRNSKKDFKDYDISYKCYMYENLSVFYYKHTSYYFVLIKIPYQDYNFTYEDAKREPWFGNTTMWYGSCNFSAEKLMYSLHKILNGIRDLQEKVSKEEIDTASLDRAYEEQLTEAKTVLTRFQSESQLNSLLTDASTRSSTSLAVYKLQRIIENPIRSFKEAPLRLQRAAMQFLTSRGYINHEIHLCVQELEYAMNWYYYQL